MLKQSKNERAEAYKQQHSKNKELIKSILSWLDKNVQPNHQPDQVHFNSACAFLKMQYAKC
jgi:hypothetical protein